MNSITDVAGVLVGHWTDADALTGCTVVIPPTPNIATCDVRGGAPGTRETALLASGMTVQQIDAIVLTGGSAFGLAAADGVMRELAAQGRGHPTPVRPVPIVPAAVVFDLAVGRPEAPDAEAGASAFMSASVDTQTTGRLGAGTGATVSKWRGLVVEAGLGSASVKAGQAVVGVLAVVNAVGDIFDLDGTSLTGGHPVPGPPVFRPQVDPNTTPATTTPATTTPATTTPAPTTPATTTPAPTTLANTTLVVVVTDATIDRSQASRLAVRAHDAMAACIRPVHTRYDGDVVFVVSCGRRTDDDDFDAVSEATFEAVATAIVRSVGHSI